MITYTWKTDQLYTVDISKEPNYVVQVEYTVMGIDFDANADGLISGNTAEFKVDPKDPNYTPYDKLTNDIVMGWVKTQLGPDGVSSIESKIASIINEKINPPKTPINTPLPNGF